MNHWYEILKVKTQRHKSYISCSSDQMSRGHSLVNFSCKHFSVIISGLLYKVFLRVMKVIKKRTLHMQEVVFPLEHFRIAEKGPMLLDVLSYGLVFRYLWNILLEKVFFYIHNGSKILWFLSVSIFLAVPGICTNIAYSNGIYWSFLWILDTVKFSLCIM